MPTIYYYVCYIVLYWYIFIVHCLKLIVRHYYQDKCLWELIVNDVDIYTVFF